MNETELKPEAARKSRRLLLPILLALPLLLLGLFFLLRGSQSVMDAWVFRILAPAAQALGRLCSHVPFSVVELLITALIAGSLIWLIYAVVRFCRQKTGTAFLRRILVLVTVWLWGLAAFYWMWNAVYYAQTFSQRTGLTGGQHSPQELAIVTDFFAWNAARTAGGIQRDEELHWDEDLDDIIARGPHIYDNIVQEFPVLEMESVPVKPFFFSRLQSTIGFTGMYSPFTGEANINADAPICKIPATIAHEMSHQRMIASEQEANFVGIAACISSDDAVYQYSGWLSGLSYLSNALYAISPDTWYSITERRFTPEVSTDWNDNRDYWASFESPVEDVADSAYDSFLKHNGQTLGVQSYGACIDLLIAYYLPVIQSLNG